MPPRAAAVLGDAHTCPAIDVAPDTKSGSICESTVPGQQTPHNQGPVFGPCSTDVFIEKKQAARTGDKVQCTGVAAGTDTIVTGAAKVFINGRNAAANGSLGVHVLGAAHGMVN